MTSTHTPPDMEGIDMTAEERSTLTDDDIETVWRRDGTVTAVADPQDADGTDADESDADGTDGDATDSTDGDSGDTDA
ncbi:MAG: hypothetical protein H0V93_06930, partial [Euzebyales bacterium]|nr:hypothetical protein [Euzebyales bacterium]